MAVGSMKAGGERGRREQAENTCLYFDASDL